MTIALRLRVLPGQLAVARLDPGAVIPVWALAAHAPLVSITRTAEELSIVAPVESVPADICSEAPWRALTVIGPLDFSLVGILAGLSGALAHAGVSLFAVSTYDTDLLLVPSDRLAEAVAALRDTGHIVENESEVRKSVDD